MTRLVKNEPEGQKKSRPKRPKPIEAKRPKPTIEAKLPPARTKKSPKPPKPPKGPLHAIAMTVVIILMEMLRGASW